MEPKKPGDSDERRNNLSNSSDDNDGDFDLSGFASDDVPAAPKADKPSTE